MNPFKLSHSQSDPNHSQKPSCPPRITCRLSQEKQIALPKRTQIEFTVGKLITAANHFARVYFWKILSAPRILSRSASQIGENCAR